MKYQTLIIALLFLQPNALFCQIYLPSQNTSGNDNVGVGAKSTDSKLLIYNWHKPFGIPTTNPNVVGLKIIQRQNNDIIPYPNAIYTSKDIIQVDQETGISNQVGTTTKNVMTLDNKGRLGLGISLPTERLDVDGNIRIRGADFKLGTGDGRPQGTKLDNRALVHGNASDELILNYDGDFEGGLGVWGPKMYVNGNLGIGTTNPTAHLHLSKDDPTIILEDTFGGSGSAAVGKFSIVESNGAGRLINDKGVTIFLDSDNNEQDNSGSSNFEIVSNAAYYDGNLVRPNFTVKGNGDTQVFGKLSIGTTDPKGYQLAVAGRMIAEEVHVKLQGTWPDYVFEQNYHLMSLKKLEKYIANEKHLPNLPSSDELHAQESIDLLDMNKKLLEKIEELTLYVIELNKQVDILKKDNINMEENIQSPLAKKSKKQ